jgi:hypothetical protein
MNGEEELCGVSNFGTRGNSALRGSLSSTGLNMRRPDSYECGQRARDLSSTLPGRDTDTFTMWGLDRLSAYSTPSGTPPPRRDSHSPAPRRGYPAAGPGSLPPRPGLVPRVSSLSLISPTASTTSLPASARVPNGAPRRRTTGGGPHHGPDPIQVLASIMGGLPRKPPTNSGEKDQTVPQKPAVVIEEIDFGGLSLQDFAAEAPQDHKRTTSVHTYSAQSVEECTCYLLRAEKVCSW